MTVCFHSLKVLITLLILNRHHMLIRTETTNPLSNSESVYAYDEPQSSDSASRAKLNKIRLNTRFQVECDLNVSAEFKFEQIYFNRSLYNVEDYVSKTDPDLDTYQSTYLLEDNTFLKVKSRAKFNNLFYIIDKFWNDNNIVSIKNSKYSNSGRYYCIYSNKKQLKNQKPNEFEYLVTSYLYLVYDEVTIVKNIKETVELDACVDNLKDEKNDLKYIQWYNNYNVANNFITNFMSLNSQTSSLVIQLDDLRLFDIVYQCHNSLSGSFKFYKLECSNCDAYLSAPIISPIRQQVIEGAKTLFTCDKPQSTRDPDRFQWFKQNTEFSPLSENKFNLSQSIGNGAVLELDNIQLDQAGWYICCVVFSPDTPEIRREKLQASKDLSTTDYNDLPDTLCSSVELKVLESMKQPEIDPASNLLFYILTSVFIISILIMAVLIFVCSKKLKNFNNAQKAVINMQNNDFYREKNELDGFNSSCSSDLDQLIDNPEELKNLKEILQSSSSIEALLTEDEVKKWRIPIENFKFGQMVGRGAFGIVVHATLKQEVVCALKRDADSGLDSSSYIEPHIENKKKKTRNINVAIKKLPDNASQKNYYDLFKELKLMLNVGEHQNIVNLIGYCIENTSLYIVTDFAKYGNLKDFLRKYSSGNESQSIIKIGPEYLMLYAYQIAMGMEYLHSKTILHRDLAARNILVDDFDSIKIADFGLARNIHKNYYYVQKLNGKVPLKWMSPESLRFQKISKESDIWSYGILLWEIYTYGCTPYPLLQVEEILEKLLAGYRMEKPKDCDDFVYENIMKSCWQMEPKNRPKFSELVESFEELLNKPEYECFRELNNKRKLQNENQALNDEELITYVPTKTTNASESECSTTVSEMRFGLNVPFCLTSSASSFNPSTSMSTNTTTTTATSHLTTNTLYKPVESLQDTQNQTQQSIAQQQIMKFNLSPIDDEPLLKKKQKFAYRTDKKSRKNPIYHEQIIKLKNDVTQAELDDNFENDKNILSFSEKLKSSPNLKNIFSLFRAKNSTKDKNRVLTSDV